MQPTIYFATDHAGFELKNELVAFVRDELNFEVVDCGAYTYDAQDDFTEFVSTAARKVSDDPAGSKAIILGGSGQGEAMIANRFDNVRACVYYGGSEKIIILSRVHNDANILSLGARFLDTDAAKKAVSAWLLTPHEPVEKYDRRIKEIDTLSADTANSSNPLSIVPSLPAQSFEEIETLLTKLTGVADGVQIDIVDGVFVPHTSWPFTKTDPVAELQKLAPYADTFEIEIDCMCMHPEQYLDLFVSLGVKRIVVHMGSTEAYGTCIVHAKKHGYKLGLAVTNDTEFIKLSPYAKEIDFIQVMGIKQVGVQGQRFDERTTHTISLIRKVHPFLEIAVDGAVNELTIPSLLQAGANRFAPGSAITRSDDPKASYEQLKDSLG